MLVPIAYNIARFVGDTALTNSSYDTSGVAIAERTFKLSRFLSGSESAEFFVLFETDQKTKKFTVQDSKFISGAEKMKLQGKQLKNIDFNIPAPTDSGPARFVWRGILGCYQIFRLLIRGTRTIECAFSELRYVSS